MASLMIHMLIGQEYCKKHKVADEQAFLQGNIAPDLAKDKRITHFSKRVSNKTYTESIKNKINLGAFCDCVNNIDRDFDRGVFLHLLTDYFFFNSYLLGCPGYKKIENRPQLEIQDFIYRDYHCINFWIMNEYEDIKLDMLPKDTIETDSGKMNVMSIKGIKKLVEFCSNLDLDKLYETINDYALEFGTNTN